MSLNYEVDGFWLLLTTRKLFPQFIRRKHWRLTGRARAEYCARSAVPKCRQLRNGVCQCWREIFRHRLVLFQPYHGLAESEGRYGAGIQLIRSCFVFSLNDHHLYRALKEVQRRSPICCRKNPKLFRHCSERLQRLLCLGPVIRLPGEMMQSQ